MNDSKVTGHETCTFNWTGTFKTLKGARNLAKREQAYAFTCTLSGTGGTGDGAWLEAVRNEDGTCGVTWHNCHATGIVAPEGYTYDRHLSDSHVAGFTDVSGDQWYGTRSALHPCVVQS